MFIFERVNFKKLLPNVTKLLSGSCPFAFHYPCQRSIERGCNFYLWLYFYLDEFQSDTHSHWTFVLLWKQMKTFPNLKVSMGFKGKGF